MTNDGRRYQVLGVLGRGGFGVVYRAEMLGEGGFKRQVALKMLNSAADAMPEVAQRLRDEARLLGMLRHRAILQGDGLVVLDDRWTVVMEYIDGVDLQQIAAQGRIPSGCAMEIAGEVASALHVAYSHPNEAGEPLKLIHRDIKPSNVLLTPIGEVKVLDFGIARANFSGREASTKGMRFGSLGYMAPERLDFQDGPAGDVYALGVLLAEIIGGGTFGTSSVRPDRHQGLISAAGDRMRSAGASEPVVAFVASMVAYDPTKRPSAREVERRCRELRATLPPPWLRDWSEEVVPPLLKGRGLGSVSDLSALVLTERSGGTASVTMAFDVGDDATLDRPMNTFNDDDAEAPPLVPALEGVGRALPPPAAPPPRPVPPPARGTSGWLWVAGLSVLAVGVALGALLSVACLGLLALR
jgi:serine/threonine protein kinase